MVSLLLALTSDSTSLAPRLLVVTIIVTTSCGKSWRGRPDRPRQPSGLALPIAGTTQPATLPVTSRKVRSAFATPVTLAAGKTRLQT
ncbi:hypothetical protein Shyhy02_25230 [Streptomyces hygroscopicus subsp. hygroscopicus]|nr:hypothetical protein Shyhy02_25230 [Streptomyces hygroscopicus subsp. hygroscopicus]